MCSQHYLESHFVGLERYKSKALSFARDMVPHDNMAHNITKLREELVQLVISEVLAKVLDKDVCEDLLSPLVRDAILACHKQPHKSVTV